MFDIRVSEGEKTEGQRDNWAQTVYSSPNKIPAAHSPEALIPANKQENQMHFLCHPTNLLTDKLKN